MRNKSFGAPAQPKRAPHKWGFGFTLTNRGLKLLVWTWVVPLFDPRWFGK